MIAQIVSDGDVKVVSLPLISLICNKINSLNVTKKDVK